DGRVPASLRISCGYDAGTEREILSSLSDFGPPTNSDKLSGGCAPLTDEHHDGPGADHVAPLIRQHVFGAGLGDVVRRHLHSVDDTTPATLGQVRQLERMCLPVRVGDDVDVLRLSSIHAIEVHGQRAGLPGPVRLPQLDAMPGD